MFLINILLVFSLSVHFNDFFPGEPGLAGFLKLRMMEMVVTIGAIRRAKLQSNHHTNKPTPSFLQAGCPSCRPTNSAKALKANNILLVLMLIYVSLMKSGIKLWRNSSCGSVVKAVDFQPASV